MTDKSTQTTDDLLLSIFQDLNERPDFPVSDIRQKVAIISTPRCGSTFFCDVLHRTGLVGDPKEWINLRYLQAYAKLFGNNNIDIGRYLDFIFRKTTSPNGVFAINFHVSQHTEMLKHKFDVFSLGFDRIYYLYRRNKAEQAYSLAKAQLTDQWSADVKPLGDASATIDKTSIINSLLHISGSEDYYLANLHSKVGREFAYEDFSRLDQTPAFDEILTDLNIEDYEASWTSRMRQQRSKAENPQLVAFKKYLFPND